MGRREVRPLRPEDAFVWQRILARSRDDFGRDLQNGDNTGDEATITSISGDCVSFVRDDGEQGKWHGDGTTMFLAFFVDHPDDERIGVGTTSADWRRETGQAPCPLDAALPQDDATRKGAPMFRGLLGYFPFACFAVAQQSMRSDRKHNGERPLGVGPNWTMDLSSDHLDCVVCHAAEIRGLTDEQLRDPAHQVEADDEEYQRTALAWRALAQLQEFGMRRYGFRRGAHARLSTDGGER